MDETGNLSNNAPSGGKNWHWIVIIIILVLVGAGVWYFWDQNKTDDVVTRTTEDKTTTETATVKEDWAVGTEILKSNTTSSDTHKLADGTYRMYFMGQGGILYANSTDGKTFGTGTATGVKEVSGKMISNPAVLEGATGSWVMIYEMAPTRQPGAQQGPPGVSNQRNLYLATSTDGKTFTASGIAIDSAKDDGYFASVPDLIKTPDGKIRMYYVSGGQAIGSALSADNGKTWTREAGYRLEDSAVDPDVCYKDGEWVMYYSVLDPAKNALYKATSTDGLKWENETKLFAATTGGAIVDPDVVEITPTNYIMFLGQSTSGGSTGGEQINLYSAELKQSIF